MILALFILVYYFYVVCDFVAQVYFYEENTSYEEHAIASKNADMDETNNAGLSNDETSGELRNISQSYLQHEQEQKSSGKKSSLLSVGSAAKFSISSSTSKLKSANKGRKSVHVIEIVEREPDPLYSQFEDISNLRSGDDPTPSRTEGSSVFDSVASVHDVEINSPREETTASISVQSSRRENKPYSHHSQRKNVSFVDETKSASSSENR